MATDSLFKGVAYGVAAGVCWGVVFIGPALTPGLSGAAFAILRFLCYGVISLALLLPRWRTVWASVGRTEWVALFWLSLIGNVLYYSLVATGVQNVGVATTSLIVGLIPVLVTLAGRKDINAVPIGRLAPALCCAMAGVILISVNALAQESPINVGHRRWGLVCAIGALFCWSWFAVSNSRRLAQVKISARDWVLLTGVMTGAQSLVLAIPLLGRDMARLDTRTSWSFLGVAAAVALVASLFGGAFWNQASRLLPLALSGQVVVVETLAALSLGFVWQQRLPTELEGTAVALLVVGVVWCLRCHQQPRPA